MGDLQVEVTEEVLQVVSRFELRLWEAACVESFSMAFLVKFLWDVDDVRVGVDSDVFRHFSSFFLIVFFLVSVEVSMLLCLEPRSVELFETLL